MTVWPVNSRVRGMIEEGTNMALPEGYWVLPLHGEGGDAPLLPRSGYRDQPRASMKPNLSTELCKKVVF